MKKWLSKACAMALSVLCVFFSGCEKCFKNEQINSEHICNYIEEVPTAQYLKSKATCKKSAEYYYSCSCGKAGEKTFYYDTLAECVFSQEVPENKYLKVPATCDRGAEYYVSCAVCGKAGAETFIYGTGACDFSRKVTTDRYLKTIANCDRAAEYYYSCVCGEHGEQTFFHGNPVHTFTEENPDEEYLKAPANCQSSAVYYKTCILCGAVGGESDTFTYGEVTECDFSEEIVDDKYMQSDRTTERGAIYYKSCAVCGKAGTETFEWGESLPVYSEEEKALYKPTSLTITLYDPEQYVYGFTFNTVNEPLKPVIFLKEENAASYTEYRLVSTQAISYDNVGEITYYISKTEITLEANKSYVYYASDKYAGIDTELTSFETKNTVSENFTFVHVSDSQGHPTEFGYVLSSVVDKADFIVHTGDVVQSSKHEYEWKAMLDGNYGYLSKIPMMAISGNHETTYMNGSNEIFKHFHNKIPAQSSTNLGYFYSFVYGNVKFIMLNTNDLTGNKLKNEQYDWLERELKNNTAMWTIVTMHQPMYSVGKSGLEEPTFGLQSQLQGLFAKYGVDFVLQGHDHLISKTFPLNGNGEVQTETFEILNGVQYSVDPKGVMYLMSGTSGGQTRWPETENATLFDYGQNSNASSWTEFEVNGNTMRVTVKWHDGLKENVYHAWGVKKTVA